MKTLRSKLFQNVNPVSRLECSGWYTITNNGFFTFDLDLGVMVAQDIAKYPSHHVTHGPGKFEVALSNV